MLLAPLSYALDFARPTEAVTVAVFAEPTPLSGGLAGLAASRLETVLLPIHRSRIGNEHLAATAAFTSGCPAAHLSRQA
jgi:hypothetical protein